MKMEKLTPLFIPVSHIRLCETGLSGPVLALRGQQHVGDFADVDGLGDLQAGDVLTVRRRIARRSRPPQIKIPDMPLTDQEKRAKRYSRNKTT
jgi:hypothetical protein